MTEQQRADTHHIHCKLIKTKTQSSNIDISSVGIKKKHTWRTVTDFISLTPAGTTDIRHIQTENTTDGLLTSLKMHPKK